MTLVRETTQSYAYKATRYELLPRISDIAKPLGDEPFLLREISKKLLSETYSEEFLETRIKKAKSEKMESMKAIFMFYIPFLATELKFLENLGGGMFKNVSIEEEMAEADAVATDVESEDAGIIYAYSFPTIIQNSGNYPIKIGLTTTGDANARVLQQCKTTCCFEFPVLIGTWDVQRVAAVEDAIHSTLEARGSKRNAPGTEWFNTTLGEIEKIIMFIQPTAKNSMQRQELN